MINRYFYKSSVSDFLNTSVDTIFGIMSRADEMDTVSTQKYAWEQEIIVISAYIQAAILLPGKHRLHGNGKILFSG